MTDFPGAGARVDQGGRHCLIQDTGRRGTLAYGLTTGGALDAYAHAWANRLVNNPRTCATLEITLGPIRLEFSHGTRIALTGADADFRLNDQPLTPGQSLNIAAGDCLSGQFVQRGLRAYISIVGGWQTPDYFHSRSIVLREQIGQAATTGTVLPYRPHQPTGLNWRIPARWNQLPGAKTLLDLIPAYQYDAFSAAARQQLTSHWFQVSPHSDRMGVRLSSDRGLDPPPGRWRSEGIAEGAVQIPPDGQPIVLLADRQTIGGYPKAGCLSHRARSQLAQCRPGDRVGFRLVSRAQARAEFQAFHIFFAHGLR